MGACNLLQPLGEGHRVALRGQFHHEAGEIVVVVVILGIVMAGAVGEVVLGRRLQPQQHACIHLALGGAQDLGVAGQGLADQRLHPGETGSVHEVGLVDYDQVGAEQLILEHLLDRGFVIDLAGGLALGGQGRWIGREAALGGCCRIHHGNHPVHRHPRLDSGPVEGLHQRLGQGEAAGLDHDMLGWIGAGQKLFDGRDEIVGHGAAQAAVRQLDHVVLGTGRVAAGTQNLTVDADVAELVDDEGQPAPLGIFQQTADQRRLAGAKEAGDDGRGCLGCDGHGMGFLQDWAGRSRRSMAPLAAPRITQNRAATPMDRAAKRAASSGGGEP